MVIIPTLSMHLLKQIRPWFCKSLFSLFHHQSYSRSHNLLWFVEARVYEVISSVCSKIAHNMPQILPSSPLFVKQIEDLERRFHHHKID